jgi:hypothetical protein
MKKSKQNWLQEKSSIAGVIGVLVLVAILFIAMVSYSFIILKAVINLQMAFMIIAFAFAIGYFIWLKVIK